MHQRRPLEDEAGEELQGVSSGPDGPGGVFAGGYATAGVDGEALSCVLAHLSHHIRHVDGLGQCDALGRADGKAAGSPTTQQGGAGPDHRTAQTAQQGPQGAYENSVQRLISRVPLCPTFAGCQHSRFILAHRLQQDMTSDSFIEVVQDAVDRTSMDQVPVTDRTRLLSDNGPGYVSRAFRTTWGWLASSTS